MAVAIALAVATVQPAQAFAPLVLPSGPTVTGLTGQRPSGTRLQFPVSDQVGVSVDVATGNLEVATQGIALRGVTASANIGATYNSLATNAGSTANLYATGWTYNFDGAGNLSSVTGGVVYTGPDGSTWLFTPVSGSSTAFTSPAGLKATLTAQVSGGVVTGYTLAQLDSSQTVAFDSSGNALSVADRNGNTTVINYTSGVPSSVVSTAGPTAARTAAFSYNTYMYTETITQTNGSSTRNVQYDKNSSSQMTSITDANGNQMTFSYTSGEMTRIKSVTGAETDFTYDTSNRVTEVDQHNTTSGSAGESTTRITYPSSTQTLVAGPDTSTGTPVASGPHVTYTIGSGYLVSSATDEMGRVRAATYTPNLDVATATSGTGGTAGTTTATYGANSGLSQTALQKPGGATSSAAYGNTATSTLYLPSSTTDDAGNQSTLTYNGAGNALTNTNTTLAATATLTYNSNGTVATATAPGNGTNSTLYGYDSNFQLHTVTPPTGTSLGVKTITYDPFGREATTTDGKGVTLTYGYDNNDHLVSTTFSDSTHSVVNTYDAAGYLTKVVSGSGTLTNTVDQLGNLLSTVNTAGGGTEAYSYDKARNLLTTTDVRGTTTNSFDASGVATQMVYTKGSGTQTTAFATDNQGRRTDEWLQTNPGNTTWAAHIHTSFDTSGRVTELVAQTGPSSTSNTTTFDTSYCYNSATPAPTCSTGATTDHSKVQWSKDNLTGQVTAYTYDAGGRLHVAAQSGGTTNNTYTYTYDANGNRLTAVVTGSTPSSQTLSYNAANQITTTGYSYDGAGNMTASPTATLTYNGAEQMTGSTVGTVTTSYVYGGASENELLSETPSTGTTYKYTYGRTGADGQPVVEQVKAGSNTATIDNDPGTGQPVMLHTSADVANLYVNDGIGNPVQLLSDADTIAQAISYDPYGNATVTTGGSSTAAAQNPYLFETGIQDRISGLVKFGARWYSPTTGTWTQEDTLDAPLDPGNGNRYAYAGDDPVNNLDSSGGVGLGLLIKAALALFEGAQLTAEFSGPGILAALAGGLSEAVCVGVFTALSTVTFGVSLVITIGCFALGAVVEAAVNSYLD